MSERLAGYIPISVRLYVYCRRCRPLGWRRCERTGRSEVVCLFVCPSDRRVIPRKQQRSALLCSVPVLCLRKSVCGADSVCLAWPGRLLQVLLLCLFVSMTVFAIGGAAT